MLMASRSKTCGGILMRTFPYPLSINSSTELGDWNGGKSLLQLKRLPVKKFDETSEKIGVISGGVCVHITQ